MFAGSNGAKINPQTVWKKDLSYSDCNDVEFIGPFDGANIKYTIFDNAISENDEFKQVFRQRVKSLVNRSNGNF